MSDTQKHQERMTYVSLVGLFVTLLGAFAFRERNQKRVFSLDPHDLALFGLATYRAGRVVAYDRVSEPFRDPVTETVPDEYQAGENVVAEGAGARKALANWCLARRASAPGSRPVSSMDIDWRLVPPGFSPRFWPYPGWPNCSARRMRHCPGPVRRHGNSPRPDTTGEARLSESGVSFFLRQMRRNELPHASAWHGRLPPLATPAHVISDPRRRVCRGGS